MNGHQEHFLSRLDRVDHGHQQLALRLYNDHDLIRYVLDRAGIGPDVERVAVSLEHPELGPFLVVTRDGHFVTCLGRGMRAGSRPVLSREVLDDLLHRGALAKQRLQTARTLAGSTLGLAPLLRRVVRRGDTLSREDFAGSAAFSPIFGLAFLREAVGAYITVHEKRFVLSGVARRRPNANLDDALLDYWQRFHAASNLLVLSAAAGSDLLARTPPAVRMGEVRLSLMAVAHGFGSTSLRAIWAASTLGDVFIDRYERAFAESTNVAELYDAALGMAALALRHPRLRPRVRRGLGSPDAATRLEEGSFVRRFAASLSSAALDTLDSRVDVATARARGATECVARGAMLPTGAKHRYERAEDVPEGIAMAAALDWIGDLWRRPPSVAFSMLPWLARADAEDLYLPEELAAVRRAAWRPQDGLELLRILPKERPEQRAHLPRRKGSCPCGSGRKFKRCCEAARERTAA